MDKSQQKDISNLVSTLYSTTSNLHNLKNDVNVIENKLSKAKDLTKISKRKFCKSKRDLDYENKFIVEYISRIQECNDRHVKQDHISIPPEP